MKKRTALSTLAVMVFASAGVARANLVTNGDFSANGGVGELNYATYAGTTYATDWTVGAQTPNPGGSNGTGAFDFVVNSQADSTGFASGNSSGPFSNLTIWGPGNSPAVSSGGPIPATPVENGFSSGVPVSAFANGTHFALGVDAGYGTAPVSQTINGLAVGDQYTLSFEYAYAQLAGYGGNVTEDWQVTLGTSMVTTPSHLLTSPYTIYGMSQPGGDQGFYGFDTFTNTFTATSSSELLSFLAQGSAADNPFLMLTNVSLVAAPQIPEPSSLSVAFMGLVTLTGIAYGGRWRLGGRV